MHKAWACTFTNRTISKTEPCIAFVQASKNELGIFSNLWNNMHQRMATYLESQKSHEHQLMQRQHYATHDSWRNNETSEYTWLVQDLVYFGSNISLSFHLLAIPEEGFSVKNQRIQCIRHKMSSSLKCMDTEWKAKRFAILTIVGRLFSNKNNITPSARSNTAGKIGQKEANISKDTRIYECTTHERLKNR